ncbi:MAG: glycoside hydrolase, partial [Armatimonadetes bacterium]|nr:glycoside hydrolase [Armatimonadota bacterium]
MRAVACLALGLCAAFLAGARMVVAGPPVASEAPVGGAVTWRNVGPGGGGWIEAIACDPKDPNVLYVGCDVGGFYFSADGGLHYEIRNAGLRNPFVEAIAVCPADSQLILLGTEGGIFRSTDQGRSWRWIRAGFPGVQRYSFSAPIGTLCFDPTNPRVAYAGIGRPRWDKPSTPPLMYRSEDAGETWVDCDRGAFPPDAIVSCVQVKPDDGRVVLAATSRGVFRSDDGGQSWRPSNEGLANLWAQELAFAPSAPNVVYLTVRTTARAGEEYNGGVYRSDDAGRTWQRRADGLPTNLGRADESPYMTASVFQIVVDPRDANVAYVGERSWVAAGVFKTTDGGRRWERVSYHWGENKNMDQGWINFWGPSVECMAISPAEPDRVYFGTSGHVYVTLDGGKTWVQRYCDELPEG